MKNSPYERVHMLKKPVKRMYRRYKNKLTKDELAGYEAFRLLVDCVEKNERFLVDKDCFQNFLKNLCKSTEGGADHYRGDFNDNKPSLLKNLDAINFNICVAVEMDTNSHEKFDLFTCFEFLEDDDKAKFISFFTIGHEEAENIESKEVFKSFLCRFYTDHFALVRDRSHCRHTQLYYNVDTKRDPQDWIKEGYSLAAALSTIILHKQDDHAAAPLVRMSDFNFARASNGSYEARNHYTYVCEQSKAPRYRRLINEKHREHGFTGTGGTKAFHFKSPHWRYYASKDEYVFVRGFFAGRQKPEVNVIR